MEHQSLKNIEQYILEALSQLKINQDKSLDFYFHLKGSTSKSDLFLKNKKDLSSLPSDPFKLSQIKVDENSEKNSWIQETLNIHFSDQEAPSVHFELKMKEQSIFLYKNLKYFFLLTNSITMYIDSEDSDLEVLKFFFVLAIENYVKGSDNFSKITLVYNKSISGESTTKIKEYLRNLWKNSLEYTGFDLNQETLQIEDLFSIDKVSQDQPPSDSEIIIGTNFNVDKEQLKTEPVSAESFLRFSLPILLSSETVTYLPENIILDEDYQKISDSYLIGRIFNDLWLTSNSVINHWSSYVSKGKVIENFGSNVSNFLSGMMEEFEKTLPSSLKSNSESLNKIKELSDMVQGRITSLFTSQLLILQTQALDKFKDILVWQAKHSSKEFEFEKGIAILQVNEWFELKASKISVPEMRLDYHGAKKELQQVLGEVTEKFKDSAVSKLISIQKTSKKTSKGKFKQSGVVVGFGVTAAVRPRGFGNLQLVTSYSQGPHVFNFSLVNDLDVAEQEGQTRIKPIRIQPSLNFDVDI